MKQTTNMPSVMTEQEVADYLAVPVRTLRHWGQVEYGPTRRKIGRHVRYMATDVVAFLKSAANSGSGNTGARAPKGGNR
jgi:hypothetical protein